MTFVLPFSPLCLLSAPLSNHIRDVMRHISTSGRTPRPASCVYPWRVCLPKRALILPRGCMTSEQPTFFAKSSKRAMEQTSARQADKQADKAASQRAMPPSGEKNPPLRPLEEPRHISSCEKRTYAGDGRRSSRGDPRPVERQAGSIPVPDLQLRKYLTLHYSLPDPAWSTGSPA